MRSEVKSVLHGQQVIQYSSWIAKRQTWNTCYWHLPEAIPCFGWGPFPTHGDLWYQSSWWMQKCSWQKWGTALISVQRPPPWDSGGDVNVLPPQIRECAVNSVLGAGKGSGTGLRAAWLWGINVFLFGRILGNTETHHQSKGFVRLNQHLVSRLSKLLSCAHSHSISSLGRTETLLSQQSRDWSLKFCWDLLESWSVKCAPEPGLLCPSSLQSDWFLRRRISSVLV